MVAAVALAAGSATAVDADAQAIDAAGMRTVAVGRFTVVHGPRDAVLARALLAAAQANDTFPGLPRPRAPVVLAIAPDAARFRRWVGDGAPEWGAAIAFPALQRIVMQGRWAGAGAGDPRVVLRHELAHLALHEVLGDLPPRWFDEGYASVAAGEWGREEVLATSVALAVRRVPGFAALDASFLRGAGEADAAYALAHRAVAELAALDPTRGLSLFFGYWRETASLDQAVRRAYGLTLDAFEDRFRARTRRRYGGIALVADLSVVGVLVLALLVPLWWQRRRRDARRLARLQQAEADADRRAAASALAALLGEGPPPTNGEGRAGPGFLDRDSTDR
jgi:hypothetical protein